MRWLRGHEACSDGHAWHLVPNSELVLFFAYCCPEDVPSLKLVALPGFKSFCAGCLGTQNAGVFVLAVFLSLEQCSKARVLWSLS